MDCECGARLVCHGPDATRAGLSSVNAEAWPRAFAGDGARTAKVLALGALTLPRLVLLWAPRPIKTGDGRVALEIAQESLFSTEFWLAERPFALSLVAKLVGGSEVALVRSQTLLAAFAWGLAATMFAGLVANRWLSVGVFVVVLGPGLATPVLGWDRVVRSESLAISCTLLVLACTLGVLRASGERRGAHPYRWVLGAALAAMLGAFARDTVAYLLPLVAALALGESRKARPVHWLAALLLAASLASNVSLQLSQRYTVPLMNTIFRRVLVSPSKLAFFREQQAMPVSAALLERSRAFATDDDDVAFRAPELAEFRGWVAARGYAAYRRYLLSRPGATIAEASEKYPTFAAWNIGGVDFGEPGPVARVVDPWLRRGPPGEHPLAALSFLALSAGLALMTRLPGARTLGLVALFAVAGTATQTYICFHADAMATERHAMMVGLILRLGILAALAALLDVTLDWLERHGATFS